MSHLNHLQGNQEVKQRNNLLHATRLSRAGQLGNDICANACFSTQGVFARLLFCEAVAVVVPHIAAVQVFVWRLVLSSLKYHLGLRVISHFHFI